MEHKVRILAISRFFKGADFIRNGANLGAEIYLLTSSKLKTEEWPWDSITETFYMEEDPKGDWDKKHLINGLAFTFRSKKFDALVALDDFDVEVVASLREYFRIGGMGETTARHFRDKLGMRGQAKDKSIPNPQFASLFYDHEINDFLNNIAPPYMIKPRGQASATGIKKVHNAQQAWDTIHGLGDQRHEFLIESFRPGDVFHVDSLVWQGKVVFSKVSRYLDTPFEVAHGGGIFRSMTMLDTHSDAKHLTKINSDMLTAFGLKYGASHSEFIKDHLGNYFFLETSSRVGGANLAEMVEAASGINLWAEWAAIEIAFIKGASYKLPKTKKDAAGIIVSLSRFEHPDTAEFNDAEIAWRMHKKHHIGFVVSSPKGEKVQELLDNYIHRIKNHYHASLPAPSRPTN
jgi:biotin carboxylase